MNATKMENKAAKRYGSKAQRGNDIRVGDWVRKVFNYESSKILKASKRGYFAPDVYIVTSVLPSRYPNALPSYKLVTKDTKQVLTGTYARWQLLKVPKDTTVVEEPEDDRPGEVEGTGGQYEVQSLVDKRTLRGGVVKYRVRWRGWKAKHDTWETEEQLMEDVPEMVAAFNREHE
ncbi:Chromobox protein 3 [Rhizophlyctis rosea]|nr:Chromobox protein 3 [Rhizophlyctis rosea]